MSEDQELSVTALNLHLKDLAEVTFSGAGFEERVAAWKDQQGFLTGLLGEMAQYPSLARASFRAPKDSEVGHITAFRRYQPAEGYDDVNIQYVDRERYVKITNSYIQVFDSEEGYMASEQALWNYRAFDVNGVITFIATRYPGIPHGQLVQERPAHLNYLLLKASWGFRQEGRLSRTLDFEKAATAHLSGNNWSGGVASLDHHRCRPEHYDWLDRVRQALEDHHGDGPKKDELSKTFAEEFAELTRYVIPKKQRTVLGIY